MAVGGDSDASEDENTAAAQPAASEFEFGIVLICLLGIWPFVGWLEQENRAFNQGGE